MHTWYELGILAVAAAFAVFGYYRWRSYREFGGITGEIGRASCRERV